ncbi:bifunctional nuclease family protein [candidate division WOR-3 bacterium]|nr:bifunctional nuclease family protein [candidate division WOR-3 bacterium]
MVEVKVSAMAFDQGNKTPIIFLKEIDGDMVLPIWIGAPEANAIAMELEGIKPVRPLTHDLLRDILNGINIRVLKVVVSKIENDTFFATIVLEMDNDLFEIDARPSDSIALALRMKVPIYVEEEVMEKSGTSIELDNELKKKALKEYLKNMDIEDFGKYKL